MNYSQVERELKSTVCIYTEIEAKLLLLLVHCSSYLRVDGYLYQAVDQLQILSANLHVFIF